MASQTIDKILLAEKQAADKIDLANRQSEQILVQAGEKAKEIMEQANVGSKTEADNLMEEKTARIKDIFDKNKIAIADEEARIKSEALSKRDKAVDIVINRVLAK